MARLPASASSVREVVGERWELTDTLLAHIADLLAGANWQRAGNKNAPRPKPIPRPGVKPHGEKRLGTASMSIDEWRTRYAARFEGSDDGD